MAHSITQDDDFLTNNPKDVNPLYEMKVNEKLPNDVSDETPFSDPDDIYSELEPESPRVDTPYDIDSDEEYDAGYSVASGELDGEG